MYKTGLTRETTLHVAKIVNTEKLQHYITYEHVFFSSIYL